MSAKETNEGKDTVFSANFSLNTGGVLRYMDRPWIIGILNITEDSFYDGGRYPEEKALLKHTGKMLDEGADVIDIGAVSTRPGSALVPAEEEIPNLLPALQAIVREFPHTMISIDTYNAQTARVAVENGAHIINDISGGTFDEEMPATIGNLKVPCILMHIQGKPENMQDNPQYGDVFKEVSSFFSAQTAKFFQQGADDIILDPGFGFGKTTGHNYQLLKRIDEFKKLFKCPVLAGASRKSMINKVLGTTPGDALNGTTIVNTMALMEGANLLRVHDVRQAVEARKIVTFTQNLN